MAWDQNYNPYSTKNQHKLHFEVNLNSVPNSISKPRTGFMIVLWISPLATGSRFESVAATLASHWLRMTALDLRQF